MSESQRDTMAGTGTGQVAGGYESDSDEVDKDEAFFKLYRAQRMQQMQIRSHCKTFGTRKTMLVLRPRAPASCNHARRHKPCKVLCRECANSLV